MTYEQYRTILSLGGPGYARAGQHASNVLAVVRRDLADRVHDAGVDPYYQNEKLITFFEWLEKEWDEPVWPAASAEPLDVYTDVLARTMLNGVFEREELADLWELYPEVGEFDFERIHVHARSLLPSSPSTDDYFVAMAYFAERAEKEI